MIQISLEVEMVNERVRWRAKSTLGDMQDKWRGAVSYLGFDVIIEYLRQYICTSGVI